MPNNSETRRKNNDSGSQYLYVRGIGPLNGLLALALFLGSCQYYEMRKIRGLMEQQVKLQTQAQLPLGPVPQR